MPYSNDYYHFVKQLNPHIINTFKAMIETGKTIENKKLSEDQIQQCLEAVILWEKIHIPSEKHTGYLPKKCIKNKNKSKQIEISPQKILISPHSNSGLKNT